MRILVTGVRGQLALALCERGRILPGFEVICIGRPQLDLAYPETITKVVNEVRPQVIVGAAAYTDVDKAEDELELADRINAIAAGVLATAASDISARLIHISTDYVYDGKKSSPYIETDAPAPRCVYGRTKLDGEAAVQKYCPAHVILRTAWIYSSFRRNFVKTMIELARTRDRLTVVDDQQGNPSSAMDIADAVLTIAERWRREPGVGLGEVYHCAGNGAATWFQLAQEALETSRQLGGPFATVTPITTAQWPTKAQRPANSTLDCAKLAHDFGWRAPAWRHSVELVIRRLILSSSET